MDGLIYVMGGANSFVSPSTYDLIEVFDPEEDSWDTTLAPMPTARHQHAATALYGKIYLIEGIHNRGEDPKSALDHW